MIEVEIWYYVESTSRIVRFSRKVNVDAVPFIGAEIICKDDHIKIDNVRFQDGGGIVCIQDNIQTQTEKEYLDSKMDEVIEDMKDSGWNVLSDKKKRGRKK